MPPQRSYDSREGRGRLAADRQEPRRPSRSCASILPILHLAGTIGPPRLRSLDAIHLASALSIGDDPEAFVTYDERLAEAAREAGLNVLMPGI